MTSKNSVIREVKLFEFYKKHIWPIQRNFVKKHLTPRCKSCFLPQSYTPIVDGVCSFCRDHDTSQVPLNVIDQAAMQDQFDTMIHQTMKDVTTGYHVLLLFSGGKDSSFLLHRLLNDYPGIRILALTVDNTFMSPVAMENVNAIIKKMDVDHIVIRPQAEMMEKMFSYAFTHLNEKGCSGTVDQFDGDFFSDVARNMAADMRIPYVVCGLSRDQVGNILGLETFMTSRQEESERRDSVAGIRLRDIFTEQEMNYWWDGRSRPEEQRPQMVFPYYIWNMEESFIKSEVLRLNLMPRGDESPLITNNTLIPLMGIVDMIQFGYSSFEPEFARMVRQGKSERTDWLYTFETLEYAAKTGRLLGNSLDEVLKRLSLTRYDLGIKGGSDELEENRKNNSPAFETAGK